MILYICSVELKQKEKMTELTVLPVEVSELANKVSPENQVQVSEILQKIFKGTAEWDKQINSIEVNSIEDVFQMQVADNGRKNVKNARLAFEKEFDKKREEVQQLKADFDLQDKLWLKAKQIMQIKFKAIEEKAEWKANFAKRYEAEQKELRTQTRIALVDKYAEINRSEFENMSETVFESFLSGLKKSFEEKQEAERLAKEKAELEAQQSALRGERAGRLRPYFSFMTEEEDDTDLGVISHDEYVELGLKLKARKEESESEKLRLQKEAEEKDRQLQEERAKAKHEAEQAELKLQEERLENQRKEAEAKKIADEHLKRIQDENRIKNEKAEKERKEAQEKINEANRKKALAELEERKKIEALQKERHDLIMPYYYHIQSCDVKKGVTPMSLHLLSFNEFNQLLDIAKKRDDDLKRQEAIELEQRKIREKISAVSPEEYAYLVQCKEVLLLLLEQGKITQSDVDNAIKELA